MANYHVVWVMGCLFSQLSSCPKVCTTFKLFDQLSTSLACFLNGIALLCISESKPGNQFKNWISSFVPKYQQQHINNNTSTTTKTFTFLKEVYIYMYHIVPGLCPWALAAQTSKIEGRRLHGGGASMVQLSQWKRPPKIQNTCTLELNRPSSLLCLCFVEASSMVVALLC